jgi:hypothetical protein
MWSPSPSRSYRQLADPGPIRVLLARPHGDTLMPSSPPVSVFESAVTCAFHSPFLTVLRVMARKISYCQFDGNIMMALFMSSSKGSAVVRLKAFHSQPSNLDVLYELRVSLSHGQLLRSVLGTVLMSVCGV